MMRAACQCLTRAPRLPLAGDERERVVSVIKNTIVPLNSCNSKPA